jgi:TRAP-type uncharacterized transport system substrate-binding protein
MRGQLALRRVAVMLGALCFLIGGWYLAVRPTTLTVAVGPPGSTQVTFVDALARVLRDARQPVRLKVVRAEGGEASSKLLDDGGVDLAVLRSDDLASRDARSIVILHKRSAMLVVRKDAGIESLRDIGGRPIAVTDIDADSYQPVLQRIMSHYDYDVDDEALQIERLSRADTVAAMAQRRIAGFVLFGNPASRRTRDMIAELIGIHKLDIAVKGVPAHEALALRFRELHTSKLPEGAFGVLPEKEEETIGVSLELAAGSGLSDQTASTLTKALMEVRTRLRSADNETYGIETPPVDQERRFLPHTGTVAFVNNEVQTLFEQYSEHLWLALFSVGIIGSSIAGLLSWAGWRRTGQDDGLAEKMRHLAARLEAAESAAEVDVVQGDFDDLILAMMREYGLRRMSDESDADPGPWLMTFAGMIERRRALLSVLAAGTPPATSMCRREGIQA